MSKSESLRNFRICLTFCLCASTTTVVSAQGWGDRRRDDSNSEFRRGGDDRGGREGWRGFGGDFSGRGFDPGRSRGEGDSRSGGRPDFGGGRPDFGGGGRPDFGGGGRPDFGGRGMWGGGPPGGGFGGDFGGFDGGGGSSRSSSPSPSVTASSTASPAKKTITLKPKDRVTVDLPSTFSQGDVDLDGQIGFYEWRQWKRGDLEQFLALDHNGDGFLTPAELVKGPQAEALPSMLAATGAPVPASTSTAPPRENTGNGLVQAVTTATIDASTDPNSPVSRAERYFSLLDKNRDGNISTEEWRASSKLKPQFESAGIDLSAPMPKNDFVKHYVSIQSSDS